MANPPFNVDKVDKEKIKDDPRFPFGMPRADNANYLWIQLFYSSLNAKGRAGFVMANSAAEFARPTRCCRTLFGGQYGFPDPVCVGQDFCALFQRSCRRCSAVSERSGVSSP
jgi:type I restriction enzyme M protein